MQALNRFSDATVVRFAVALSHLLTWGQEETQRSAHLLESEDDWQSMYADLGGPPVVLRALRGIPATFIVRMHRHEPTAVPVGLVLTMVALSGTGASLLARTYPADVRFFALVTALGLGLVALVFLREPRRLAVPRFRLPAALTTVGTFGMAATMPSPSDWTYQVPVLEDPQGDALMLAGFITVGVTSLLVATTPTRFVGKRWMLVVGTGAFVGLILFGSGQVVWGVKAVVVDPAITATSLGVGLGNLSLAHLMLRLRNLELDLTTGR